MVRLLVVRVQRSPVYEEPKQFMTVRSESNLSVPQSGVAGLVGLSHARTVLTVLGRSFNCRHSPLALLTSEALPKESSINEKRSYMLVVLATSPQVHQMGFPFV